MSYCRWSSENWSCDVYVYEDVMGGWTTWVAASRHVFDPPLEPLPDMMTTITDVWLAAYREQMDRVKDAPLKPIGLPHDGQKFNHETPGECADNLERLRGLGYNVPQYAIEQLREESLYATLQLSEDEK